MDLAFAEAGLLPPFVPELEPRLASFDLGYGDPSWLAALEAIVDSWLAAGALADARTALERLRASSEGKHRVEAGACLARAHVVAAAARRGRRDGRRRRGASGRSDTEAPWWRSQALRALAAAGAAPAEALAEAAALERSLGIEPSP